MDVCTIGVWTFGEFCLTMVLAYPIGQESSSIHKLWVIPAFGALGAGAFLYLVMTIIQAKVAKRRWFYTGMKVVTQLACLCTVVYFLYHFNDWKAGKNQHKMSEVECKDKDEEHAQTNCGEVHLLKSNTEHGMCTPSEFGRPMKEEYACDVTGLDLGALSLDKASDMCSSLENKHGASCQLFEAKQTAWFAPSGTCKSKDKGLQEYFNKCSTANAMTEAGLYDDEVFGKNCRATMDEANKPCKFTSIAEGKKYWRMWSVWEIASFGAIMVTKFIMTHTWLPSLAI